jgi:hypothetical protein
MHRDDRRRFLQAGIAAGALLVLPRWGWGQSSLLAVPKLALILGNRRYKGAPLRNPVHDARAMADAVKAVGFSVALGLDAGRAQMTSLIEAYTQELARQKCVGLFYYAGHGFQLAWKNYMLPVDADLDTSAEVQRQAVEVNGLLDGLAKAGNPMNVIILDACRDNPFGSAKEVEQKGLSQMDAPHGTLLAYATSPGHVASDGEGANGLYTEHLLKEMKVPEAKIEDVFKRVRLGVRRKSNGQQIPWESTSLEEDFWFIPPASVNAPSDAEKERQLTEELALWDRVKDSGDAASLEDFLRRFPSGSFVELAQLRLDRVLAKLGEQRLQVTSPTGNPYSKGSAAANLEWRVGDTYHYRLTDLLTNKELKPFVNEVTAVTQNEVHYGNGEITDLLGNFLRRSGGRIYSPNQLEPLDYTVGKRWTTQFYLTTPKGKAGRSEMELKIVGREPVTVPAGTFNAFRIEGQGVFEDEKGKVEVTHMTKWMVPDRVRRYVLMEEAREMTGGGREPGRKRSRKAGSGGPRVTRSQRWELVSYRQA